MTFATPIVGQQSAELINTLFWVSATIGRAAAIFFARFPSKIMLFFELVGSLISVIAWLSNFENEVVIWVTTITFGFFVGPLYPTIVASIESFVPLTGSITIFFVIAGGIGDFLSSIVILNLIAAYGSISFPICILVSVIGMLLGHVLVLFLGFKDQKQISFKL